MPGTRDRCPVLGNDEPEASVAGEIVPSREFYDYESKYIDDGSVPLIPAPISEAQAAEVRALSIAAFKAIDGAGMARVDFLLARDTGVLYLNEVNTIPGFTTIGMFAKLWAASGLTFPQLVDRLIGSPSNATAINNSFAPACRRDVACECVTRNELHVSARRA